MHYRTCGVLGCLFGGGFSSPLAVCLATQKRETKRGSFKVSVAAAFFCPETFFVWQVKRESTLGTKNNTASFLAEACVEVDACKIVSLVIRRQVLCAWVEAGTQSPSMRRRFALPHLCCSRLSFRRFVFFSKGIFVWRLKEVKKRGCFLGFRCGGVFMSRDICVWQVTKRKHRREHKNKLSTCV